MRFTVALLALASAVAAQTAGFDVITKPTEDTKVPAGSAYTIEWTPSSQTGTVSLTLLGGSSPTTLQILNTLKSGVASSAGKYSWDVPSTLDADNVYGIKISLDSDPSTFQYSFPFHVVAAASGKSAAGSPAKAAGSPAVTPAVSSVSSSVTSIVSAASSTEVTAIVTVNTTVPCTTSTTTPAAVWTPTVVPVAPVFHNTTTLCTSTKSAGVASTGWAPSSVVSGTGATSAKPTFVTTSGAMAGRTVSLTALVGALALAYAAL